MLTREMNAVTTIHQTHVIPNCRRFAIGWQRLDAGIDTPSFARASAKVTLDIYGGSRRRLSD